MIGVCLIVGELGEKGKVLVVLLYDRLGARRLQRTLSLEIVKHGEGFAVYANEFAIFGHGTTVREAIEDLASELENLGLVVCRQDDPSDEDRYLLADVKAVWGCPRYRPCRRCKAKRRGAANE